MPTEVYSKNTPSLNFWESSGYRDLQPMIAEYEAKQNEQEDIQNREDLSLHPQNKLNLKPNLNYKRSIKPLRMFKDVMEQKKQNREKNQMIAKLQQINKQLKRQYGACLKNNKKMEQFLKEIQFTFKNDQSNQKANEILTRAKKALTREEQQSKNNFKKISKNPKTNSIIESRLYFEFLQEEREKLTCYLERILKQNQQQKCFQDFNAQKMSRFVEAQKKINQIMLIQTESLQKIREKDKLQVLQTGIKLKAKKKSILNRSIQKLNHQIAQQMLLKEGYEYEIQILNKKNKRNNKRNHKDDYSTLKIQIKNMKKKISDLQKQLKQKRKTYEYITKWTKQLKSKLDERKKQHTLIKEKYEEQINKQSRQYEEWNRKYKIELVEQQSTNKKVSSNEMQIKQDRPQSMRNIRIVKIDEIMRLKKVFIFRNLQNSHDPYETICEYVLKGHSQFTLKQLNESISKIPYLFTESQAELTKLARYIIEDPNTDYTSTNSKNTISTHLASLIFRHLFESELLGVDLDLLMEDAKVLVNRGYDELRQDLWKQAGKTNLFVPENLANVLRKRYKEEIKIRQIVQFFQFLIWKHFDDVCTMKLQNFEKICEVIVGRKLIKNSNIRISTTTIKSIFNKRYNETKKKLSLEQDQEQI